MNVDNLKPVKRKLEWLIKAFNMFYKLKLGKNIQMSVENSGNPIVHKLYGIVNEVCDDVKDHKYYRQRVHTDHDRYRRLIREPTEFALAIYYTDSAWRDIGTAVLYKILMAKNELLPLIEAELKDPQHYYFNIWEDFQAETIDMQKKGDLPQGIVSNSESYMVDSSGKQRINDIYAKKQSKEKKVSHW